MAELKKYVCGPCGYVYDPEIGDPDNGVARELRLRRSQRIGYVQSVGLARMRLRKNRILRQEKGIS